MMPVDPILESTILKLSASAPSAKSRLPWPIVMGWAELGDPGAGPGWSLLADDPLYLREPHFSHAAFTETLEKPVAPEGAI